MSQQTEQIDKTETDAEGSVNIRTFKKTPEVESFYRFVYDNNLHKEARLILEKIYNDVLNRKTPKKRKRAKKIQ